MGLVHQAMAQVQHLHQAIIQQPGFYGKVYSLCCDAVASTVEAMDLELRLSNSSYYSQMRLAWEVWDILDTMVLPCIVRKISSWSSDLRLGFPRPKALASGKPRKPKVTKAEVKLKPRSELPKTSFPKEDTVLSSGPNLDLPLPTGNPSMSTHDNNHVELGTETKLDKAQKFRSSTDGSLETPKEMVNWKIISASGSQDGSGSDVEVLNQDVLAKLDRQSYPSTTVSTVTEISQLEFSQINHEGTSFFHRDLSTSVPKKVHRGEPVFEELGKRFTSVEESKEKTDKSLIKHGFVQDEVVPGKEASTLKHRMEQNHEVEPQQVETINANSCRKEAQADIFFATTVKTVPEHEILKTEDPKLTRNLVKAKEVFCSTVTDSKMDAAVTKTPTSASVGNDVVIKMLPAKSKASVPDPEAEKSYTEMFFDEETDNESSPDDGSTDKSDEISFRDILKEQPLNGKMFTDWTSPMVQNFEQSSAEIVTRSLVPVAEEVERQNRVGVDGVAGAVVVDVNASNNSDDGGDHSRVRNEASKHHELMFANGLETLFEEDGAGDLGGRVVEGNVRQKAIHIPIPDMSPPLSPVQTICSCCDQDQDKPVECRNKTEEIYSDPEIEDETRSKTDTFHSSDFSPSTGSSKRSISGYFRQKLSKLMKSNGKLDVSHEGSDDLTVKSKWKKSHGDLTFSDSWNQMSPNSSLSGSPARPTANKTWSGSSLSFFSKRKRGKLSVSDLRPDHQHHYVVDQSFAEESQQNPTLSMWQKSASISNLPDSSATSFPTMTPKTSSALSAKSTSDISDLSQVSGQEGTKSR